MTGQKDGAEAGPDSPEPDLAELEAPAEGAAKPPSDRHANYGTVDYFHTTFHPPVLGHRQVWMATRAAALVQCAEDDRPRWKAVADMMRACADMVEKDGLGSLPWSHWGDTSRRTPNPRPDGHRLRGIGHDQGKVVRAVATVDRTASAQFILLKPPIATRPSVPE